MQPIQSFIDQKYLTRVKFNHSLTQSIRSRLAKDLAQYCWVAGIEKGCLMLVTDRAERATLLRYQQHEIIKQANEELASRLKSRLRKVKIRVDYRLASLNKANKPTSNQTVNRRETYKRQCAALQEILNKEDY